MPAHWNRRSRVLRAASSMPLLAAALTLVAVPSAAQAPGGDQKVEQAVLDQPDGKEMTFWVELRAEADLAAAPTEREWDERGETVVEALRDTADRTQRNVVEVLDAGGTSYETFWISNTVRVSGDEALAIRLAALPEVERVTADRTFTVPEPVPAPEAAPQAVEWNVERVRAPEVWSTFGTRGDGIVVANIDTGVQYDHPALVAQYRGNSDGAFEHNYNWFDPSNVCGNPSLVPCDNNRHGTHTMGTMVGGDGAGEQVGVAPDARWIAAKGCESGSCSQSALLASGQWVLAPTDLNGQNPRPDLRPDIVNNSWGGAGGRPWYQDTVDAWVAAGIFPVFSNGNSGPGCNTSGSPGDYASSYSVGAFDSSGVIASFSSRGSASSGVKPDIAAPGSGVRSSVPGGAYSPLSGTSMAAPHVAGAVALMWSAAPSLAGDVAATRAVLDQSAVDTSDLACGGADGDNNVWGEGRLDAFAAVDASPRGPWGTFRGLVIRDGSGEPVTGARVTAVGPVTASLAAEPPAPAGPVTRWTLTGDAGQHSLRLPIGTYQVTVSAFGFTVATADVEVTDATTVVRDFSLASTPSYTVAGTVTDDAGQPVPGMRVALTETPLQATTDIAGSYSFREVPEGSYDIVITGAGCHGGSEGTVAVDGDETADFGVVRVRDSFGHSCRSVPPAYVETGTVVPLTGDDTIAAVPLPFPFNFYGTSYGTAQVTANGVLGFGTPSFSWTNTTIPSASLPNGAIYPFWDDLYIDAASSSVRTEAIGTEPDRRFVIEWRNLRYHGDATRWVDFEVILGQNGSIVVQYRNIGDDPRERGGEATVGLENATGTVALQWGFNKPLLPVGESAVRFDTAASTANVAPDAVDDGMAVAANVAKVVPVVANDGDPEGDPLTVTAVSDPPHGTATLSPDRTVTYRPDASWVGADSFTYDLSDGKGGTDRALVTVDVTPPRPPVVSGDTLTTAEDVQAALAVLVNDSDPDGGTLAFRSVSDPPHGSAWSNADGTVTYSPDANYHGPDSFTYEVRNNSALVASATVAVTVSPVNDLPLAVADNVATSEDTPVTVNVLANDSDVDGNALAVTAVADPAHGTATVNPDRTVRYQPDPDWSGTESFTYTVGDGAGGARTATVWAQVRG